MCKVFQKLVRSSTNLLVNFLMICDMEKFNEIVAKLESFGMQRYEPYEKITQKGFKITGVILRCFKSRNLNSDDCDDAFYVVKHDGKLFEMIVERNGDEYLQEISIDDIDADFIIPYEC